MGFDPRRWQTPPRGRPITANVDALLAENDALRQEVWALRQQLEVLRRQAASQATSRVTSNTSPGLTAEHVERWCQAMARHPAWTALRVGPPGGLRNLVDALRRHWWNPALSLEEELNRQSPGLGTAFGQALRGPHSRGRWAVRAAFALYGPRAAEWLSEDPLRVVEELGRRVEQLDRRQGPDSKQRQAQGQQRRKGTRTANNSQAPGGSSTSGAGTSSGTRSDFSSGPRAQALKLLGLAPEATPEAIKRAYRRLAKAHHPDLGGDAEAFHRLEAAYRLLLG
ncbi:MAG: DnaJ domain-containing protein [Cyanobacteriota bacterium]|nr:DnaJ domain-containing protein [Cyanobacteriota bacterium]